MIETIEAVIVLFIVVYGHYRILKDGSIPRRRSEVIIYKNEVAGIKGPEPYKGIPYYDHGKFISYIKL